MEYCPPLKKHKQYLCFLVYFDFYVQLTKYILQHPDAEQIQVFITRRLVQAGWSNLRPLSFDTKVHILIYRRKYIIFRIILLDKRN